MSFSPGDLVFAKMKGYRPWPARINVLPEGVHIPKGKYPIFFFGTHQICTMTAKDMFPFEANKEKYGKPGQQWFNDSMQEAESNPHLYEIGHDPNAVDFLSQFYSFLPTDGEETLNKTEASVQDATLNNAEVSTPAPEAKKRTSLPSRPKKSKAGGDGTTAKRRNTIAGESQPKAPKTKSTSKSKPKAASKKTPSMNDDAGSMSSLSSASGSDDEPLSSFKQPPETKPVKTADEILLVIQKRQLKEEKQALKRLDAQVKKVSLEKKTAQVTETTDSFKSSDEALVSSTQEEVAKFEPPSEHKHTKRRSAHHKTSYREGEPENDEEGQKMETEESDHKHTKRRSTHRKINYQESETEDNVNEVKNIAEPSSLPQTVSHEESGGPTELNRSAPKTISKKRKRLDQSRESSVSSLKSSGDEEEDFIQKKRHKEKSEKVKRKRKSSPPPKRSKVQNEPEENKSAPVPQTDPARKSAGRLQFKVDVDEDNTGPTGPPVPPQKTSTPSSPPNPRQQMEASQSLERNLVRYNQLIKVCLLKGKVNYPRCIGTIKRLLELTPSVKWIHLARCWNLMETLKRCCKYRFNEEVKKLSQELYRNFLEKQYSASPQEKQHASRIIHTYHGLQKATQRNMEDSMQENGAPLANTSDTLVTSNELMSPSLEKSVTPTSRPSFETKPVESNSILSQKNSSIINTSEKVPPTKVSTSINVVDLHGDEKNESIVSKEVSIKTDTAAVTEEEDPDAIYSSLLAQLPGFELLREDLGIKENSAVPNKPPNVPQKSLHQPMPGRITEPVAVEWSDEALQAGAAAARQRQRMHMRQRSGRMRVQHRAGSSRSHSSSSTSSESDSSSSSGSSRSQSSSNESASENRKPSTISFHEKMGSKDKSSELEKQLPHVAVESSPPSTGIDQVSPSVPFTAPMLPIHIPLPSGSGPIMDLETRIQHMRSQSAAQAALLSNLDKSPGKWKQ